jgi:hypothetical protein
MITESGLGLSRRRIGAGGLGLALQSLFETDAHALTLLEALTLERGRQPDVPQTHVPNRSITHFLLALRKRPEP